MSDLHDIEYQRGAAIGREVMEYFTSSMKALDAEGQALVPVAGDPAATFRRRLELTDRGLAEIDRVTDQIDWLMDGAVPAEISNEFARYRGTLEQARRNVEHQLIRVVAQSN